MGVISGLASWAIWAYLTYMIGTKLLSTPETEATVANEDAYLITKTMRSMGLVYIDHQARI